jgi:ribose 5-phosphate isomerase A
MAEELIHMVGVVEHGLFLNRVNDVIVGRQNGPEILHAR